MYVGGREAQRRAAGYLLAKQVGGAIYEQAVGRPKEIRNERVFLTKSRTR
jgi:hypothetical protein